MLPEPKVGQIWACIGHEGNIFRLKTSKYFNGASVGWICEDINPGIHFGSRFFIPLEDWKLYYFVGNIADNPDVPNPNYKPEPAVGQFWTSQLGSQIRLIKFNSDKEVFETDVLSNYSGSYLTRSGTFIGWYDTSLLVTVPSVDLSRYPHKCSCGAAAYIGFNQIDCSKGCRK